MNLNVNLCGYTLKNPLIAASGTFGYGGEFSAYLDVSRLGGICSKGLTLHPREGNPGIRMWETPAGMLNSIGLQNPGITHFIRHELTDMRKLGTTVIANMGGGTLEEYIEGARLLSTADIDMLELNISCPNVKAGGIAFGMQPDMAHRVVSAVREVFAKPLMVKLSPNAPSLAAVAQACESAGADCLSLINTLLGMAVDINRRKPVFANIAAGLSGPAIRPVALRMVYDVARAVKIPVVGLGGIMTGRDAVEFIMAGASAVQVGTANLVRPDSMAIILAELEEFMHTNRIECLDEIRGCITGG
ncbi:MAG: dihydroorotate dehydrogenase [Oscillospiraceae bacterium]|nr:dihydroorotate dehydrogenase [Oscillospiraceae bacterium]